MWFIFQYSLPLRPRISSIGIAALGFPWYRSSHPQIHGDDHLGHWEAKTIRLLYEGGLKRSQADYDTMVEFDKPK